VCGYDFAGASPANAQQPSDLVQTDKFPTRPPWETPQPLSLDESIGPFALANTAAGIKALGFHTKGNYNTASGFDALYLNTTGSENPSGFAPLNCNTSGS
jgi:hypothetical protein